MRIAICDDHCLFADALSAMLRGRGHDVVVMASDPAEAIEMIRPDEVDVCIMDLSFGGTDIERTLSVMSELKSRVQVMVLSGHDDDHHRHASLEAGATTFASKAVGGDELVDLIEQRAPAGQGRKSASAGSRSGPSVYFLTEREREVLHSLVEGHSTAMIAARFGVRDATARSHIQSVLMKLGVHSRLAAVAFAVDRGLVAPAA